MAKLILSLDGQMIKEIALSKERTTIGRKPHNDIQIDNLAVSGEHAIIMTILNDSFLEDLGSTNGTLVNGQPVKKHFLQSSDVVEIGKYKLKYMNEAHANMSQAEFEKTMVLRAPASAPKKPKSNSPTPRPTQSQHDAAATRNGRDLIWRGDGQGCGSSPFSNLSEYGAPVCGGGRMQVEPSRFCLARMPARNCRSRSH